MEKDFLVTRVNRFAAHFGLPINYSNAYEAFNWVKDFKEEGAISWCERDRLSKLYRYPQIAPGAQVVVVSKVPASKEYATLVQIREVKDDKLVVCFPGGASDLWKYGDRVEIEHPILTAYREFEEETGKPLDVLFLKYFTYTCTTNKYEQYPDAYAPSMFYMTEMLYEKLLRYGVDGGSVEGDILCLSLTELKNQKYVWYENSEEAFELLYRKYT